MNYAIETENLTKKYGSINAVDNLNIRVPQGKIYGFLGKNGAGKTTTIRMIMGLIRADAGRILVFGRDACKERRWAARRMGSIVETPGFYENLSARGNLDITCELFGADRKRIGAVLDIVKLSDAGEKKVRDFSLGMKQRLGIANALVHSPGILILDEPANGLDPSGIKDLRILLRDLSENEGITVMVSSHILGEVQQMADYAGIIDRGRLVEETEIQSIMNMEQSCLLLEVDRIPHALELLEKMGLKAEQEGNSIRVACKKSMNSVINRNLVQAQIDVTNLSSVTQSLEERFLLATGEGVRYQC